MRRALDRPKINLADLDSDLKEGHLSRSFRWLEDGMRRGASREELVSALFEWLQAKKSLTTLKIVGYILSNEGNRLEFARLHQAVSDMPDAEKILGEVQFNIFRRTLI